MSDTLTVAGVSRVITMDLHQGQIQGFFNQPVNHLTALPILADYFESLHLDDCVVVSMTQTAWFVHWFNSNGILVNSLKLRRSELPMPEKGQNLVASLDRIVPDLSGSALLIKVDYYREAIDPTTKASAGVEFNSSCVYRMDLRDGKFAERWRILRGERPRPSRRLWVYSWAYRRRWPHPAFCGHCTMESARAILRSSWVYPWFCSLSRWVRASCLHAGRQRWRRNPDWGAA